LDQYDVDSISEMKSWLNQLTVAQVLDAVSATNTGSIFRYVDVRYCIFDHYGYLVFPETTSEVISVLERNGLTVDPPVPSVVVKSRLCSRYRLSPDGIDVRIVRGAFVTERFGRREIEIFAAMATPGFTLPAGMVDRERQSLNESHVALMVGQPERTLAQLRRQLLDSGVLVADGAGYNPFEKPHEGGRSVLYFRSAEVPSDHSFAHRLELTCAGEYANVIADHMHASGIEMVTGGPSTSVSMKRRW
jgi:hypothetical protein